MQYSGVISVPYKRDLRVNSKLEELPYILSWFNRLNESLVPGLVWIQCQTALAEGFTNAVRHAHKNRKVETPIDIEVTVSEASLQIRIWDQGPEFNLQKKLQSLPQAADTNAFGGRGIQLIARLTDDFSYTRTESDRNCLLLVKRFLPNPPSS
jgi:serine/threonine-protein kinase RsbW